MPQRVWRCSPGGQGSTWVLGPLLPVYVSPSWQRSRGWKDVRHLLQLSELGSSLPAVLQLVQPASPLNMGIGLAVVVVGQLPPTPHTAWPPLCTWTHWSNSSLTQNFLPSTRLNPLCIIFPFQFLWVENCKSLCCVWTHYVPQNKPNILVLRLTWGKGLFARILSAAERKVVQTHKLQVF